MWVAALGIRLWLAKDPGPRLKEDRHLVNHLGFKWGNWQDSRRKHCCSLQSQSLLLTPWSMRSHTSARSPQEDLLSLVKWRYRKPTRIAPTTGRIQYAQQLEQEEKAMKLRLFYPNNRMFFSTYVLKLMRQESWFDLPWFSLKLLPRSIWKENKQKPQLSIYLCLCTDVLRHGVMCMWSAEGNMWEWLSPATWEPQLPDSAGVFTCWAILQGPKAFLLKRM